MKKRSVFLKLLSVLLVTTQLTGTVFADTGDKAKNLKIMKGDFLGTLEQTAKYEDELPDGFNFCFKVMKESEVSDELKLANKTYANEVADMKLFYKVDNEQVRDIDNILKMEEQGMRDYKYIHQVLPFLYFNIDNIADKWDLSEEIYEMCKVAKIYLYNLNKIPLSETLEQAIKDEYVQELWHGKKLTKEMFKDKDDIADFDAYIMEILSTEVRHDIFNILMIERREETYNLIARGYDSEKPIFLFSASHDSEYGFRQYPVHCEYDSENYLSPKGARMMYSLLYDIKNKPGYKANIDEIVQRMKNVADHEINLDNLGKDLIYYRNMVNKFKDSDVNDPSPTKEQLLERPIFNFLFKDGWDYTTGNTLEEKVTNALNDGNYEENYKNKRDEVFYDIFGRIETYTRQIGAMDKLDKNFNDKEYEEFIRTSKGFNRWLKLYNINYESLNKREINIAYRYYLTRKHTTTFDQAEFDTYVNGLINTEFDKFIALSDSEKETFKLDEIIAGMRNRSLKLDNIYDKLTDDKTNYANFDLLYKKWLEKDFMRTPYTMHWGSSIVRHQGEGKICYIDEEFDYDTFDYYDAFKTTDDYQDAGSLDTYLLKSYNLKGYISKLFNYDNYEADNVWSIDMLNTFTVLGTDNNEYQVKDIMKKLKQTTNGTSRYFYVKADDAAMKSAWTNWGKDINDYPFEDSIGVILVNVNKDGFTLDPTRLLDID